MKTERPRATMENRAIIRFDALKVFQEMLSDGRITCRYLIIESLAWYLQTVRNMCVAMLKLCTSKSLFN